jgi:hypothetical protein
MEVSHLAKAYNDHNVYILGAGFAAEAGLPVIKGFMNRMRDAVAWLEGQSGREREQEAISRVLEFRLRAAAAAHRVPLNVENVEELFSLASASGSEELAEAMPLAIAATLDYAQKTATPVEEWRRFQIGVANLPGWSPPRTWKDPLPYVQEGMKRGDRKGHWYSCPPYDFYIGVMAGYFNSGGAERQDTIISFNYDLLVEESCRNLGIPIGYGFQVSRDRSAHGLIAPAKDTKLQILKLHGSVNWVNFAEHLWSPEEKARRSQPLALGEQEDWELGDDWPGPRVFEDYAEVRKRGFSPLLLAPTWRKDFAADQYARADFSSVWDAAVAALRTATNVIILGYSVPNTDQHFRYLLAAGLQDNISLRKVFFVNPALDDKSGNEKERTRLREQLIGTTGLFRPEHKDHGVLELIAANTREFFSGPHDAPGVEPYRVRIGRRLNPPTCTRDDACFHFSDRPENLGAWG